MNIIGEINCFGLCLKLSENAPIVGLLIVSSLALLAAGRSIFVSLGLLEILNDNELKAVLAHEAWHIRNNSLTPFMKQLAVMTFSSHKRDELEELADIFAAEIAGSEALSSARCKVDKVFI